MFDPQSASWAEWLSSAATEMNAAVWDSILGMATYLIRRLPYLAAGVIVAFIFWLFSRLARRIFMAGTRKTGLDARLRILFARLIAGAVIGLGFLTALTVIIPSFDAASLIAGLGFTSFVVGFATKDILNNFLSGILILWGRPFNLGDYLFVGSHQGVVEYIGVRATSLRKDDGEVVIIPNGDMYSQALTIRGAGARRRMNFRLSIGFTADAEHAMETITAALEGIDGIVAEPAPNVYVAGMSAGGIEIAVNFWINTRESSPLNVFNMALIETAKALKHEKIEIFPNDAGPDAGSTQPPKPSPRKKPLL